jgi:hypothetical protein
MEPSGRTPANNNFEEIMKTLSFKTKLIAGIAALTALTVAIYAQAIGVTFAAGVGTVYLNDTNGNAIFQSAAAASAVNYLRLLNSATGVAPQLSVGGSDTNIGLSFLTKGTGSVTLATGGATNPGISVINTASAINGLSVTPGATTVAPIIGIATTTDTNVGIAINTKGTGLVTTNGAGPTDGYYFVPPQDCNFALTTGTLAANSPATSGGASQPQMVRAAASNPVMQLTTTAAANTTEVTCDITPPSRLTAGKGVTINAVDYLFGYQTTALTTIGTATLNTVTYPAAGGSAAGTVATNAGGTLTVTAGTSHSSPGSTTTTGQCFNEKLTLGTPLSINTDSTRVSWTNTFAQSASAATVLQVCGSIVYYTNQVL